MIKISSIIILIVSVFISCSNLPLWNAHIENEAGIASYNTGLYSAANTRFSTSISYNIKSEIPLYNLANSYFKDGQFSQAHNYYLKAIEINIHLGRAYYNDAFALYYWGKSELDENYCNIEKTTQLFDEAKKSLFNAIEHSPQNKKILKNSREMISFIENELKQINSKHEENKQLCKKEKEEENQNQNNNQGNNQNNSSASEESQNEEKEGNNNQQNSNQQNNTSQSEPNSSSQSMLTSQEQSQIEDAYNRMENNKDTTYFSQSKSQQIRESDRENVDWDMDY
jgi:Ca-activated chloride channel family protein